MKIQRIYFFLSGLILFNMIFGPLVRATDSGLACPDWPLCHGKFVPEWTFHIFMEVGHRYYSGVLGLLIGAAFIKILLNAEERRLYLYPSLLSMILLVSQVTLGALTVTKLLEPSTVNLHLLNALFLLIACLTIALMAKEGTDSKFNALPRGRFLFMLLVAGILFQIFLGGKVSSHYAGLACADFPTCNGMWFPEMVGQIGIQMEHRLLGYIVTLLVLATTAFAIFQLDHPKVKFFLKLGTYLIVLQLLLGAFNVLYQLPKLLTGLHTLNAVLVFLSCYIACFYHFRQKNA